MVYFLATLGCCIFVVVTVIVIRDALNELRELRICRRMAPPRHKDYIEGVD